MMDRLTVAALLGTSVTFTEIKLFRFDTAGRLVNFTMFIDVVVVC